MEGEVHACLSLCVVLVAGADGQPCNHNGAWTLSWHLRQPGMSDGECAVETEQGLTSEGRGLAGGKASSEG